MAKTHGKQCSPLCLQHQIFVVFHCFSGFSQLFDPQNKVVGVYPTTKSQKFSWRMVLVSLHLLFGSFPLRNVTHFHLVSHIGGRTVGILGYTRVPDPEQAGSQVKP